MVLSHKCSCGPCLIFLRNIYLHSVLECNHYKALGLSSTATQAEIKSAYYELSKKHHPDKNQGSEKSAEKFRDITAAYEVLGNEKSRKQYDKEQLLVRNTVSDPFRARSQADYNDDFERMYYYERRKQSSRRYGYGKTKHFDFDTWYKAHYIDYINQKYYRYNYKPHINRMYQDPYCRNSNEPFKKAQNFQMYFFVVFFTSAFFFICLKSSVR